MYNQKKLSSPDSDNQAYLSDLTISKLQKQNAGYARPASDNRSNNNPLPLTSSSKSGSDYSLGSNPKQYSSNYIANTIKGQDSMVTSQKSYDKSNLGTSNNTLGSDSNLDKSNPKYPSNYNQPSNQKILLNLASPKLDYANNPKKNDFDNQRYSANSGRDDKTVPKKTDIFQEDKFKDERYVPTTNKYPNNSANNYALSNPGMKPENDRQRYSVETTVVRPSDAKSNLNLKPNTAIDFSKDQKRPPNTDLLNNISPTTKPVNTNYQGTKNEFSSPKYTPSSNNDELQPPPSKIKQPIPTAQSKNTLGSALDLKTMSRLSTVEENHADGRSNPDKQADQDSQTLIRFETKIIDGRKVKEFAHDPTSEFNQLLDKFKTLRKKFSDPEFPAKFLSLTGGLSEQELIDQHGDCGFEWGSLVWLRPDDFYGKDNYKMFNNGVSSDDIQQGSLGDCYFLSVLASLAEFPHRIEKLLVTKETNAAGAYAIRMCDMGEWQEIILDDQFPCSADDRTPVFSKGKANELWVMLLEKAWAKLYSSFANIEAGLTREALHDLTGAPTKYYLTEDISEADKVKMWHDIIQGDKMQFVMTCGAADFFGGLDQLTDMGLVASHAYSLLGAKEAVLANGQKVRLVELRNPWGSTEWKGDWSDESPDWTPELKKQLNIQDRDDGDFHMAYEDFLKYFSDVQICKIHDDHHYTSIRAACNYKNASFFRLTVVKDGKYYITVNQQSKRHHKKAEDFRYSAVWLVIAKQNGDEIEHIEGCFKDDREVWSDGNLKKGDYIIYVKIAWYDKTERDFVLSAYGPDDVKFTIINKEEEPDFIEKVYMARGRASKKIETYADLGQPNCSRAVELTDEGYGFIYYQNKSNKTLNEQIQFTMLQGLKLCKPFRGTSFNLKLPPGQDKIVMLKIDPNAECCKQAFKEKVKFE